MRKLDISIENYPSDKNLYDLIVAQKMAKTKLQRFLKMKGIFCTTENIKDLASLISSLILDEKDFKELISFTNVKENRFKTTSYQFSSKSSLDQLVSKLQGLQLSTNPEDYRVRLDNDNLEVNVNKESKEVLIEHQFSKIDFTKNVFLQKENHEFSYKIKELGPERYEIFLKSTCPEAEGFVNQIHETLKSVNKTESYLHEILWAELKEDKSNTFFDEILKTNKHGFVFESAINVKMQIKNLDDEPAGIDSISPSLEAIVDENDIEYDQEVDNSAPMMKSLSVSGTNILEHADVKDLRSKGFCIRSVSGIFTIENSSTTTLKMTINLEFNQYGKFQTEIKKSWLVLNSEGYKETKNSLSNAEKETHLTQLNNAAFEIYDIVRQSKDKKKSKKTKS